MVKKFKKIKNKQKKVKKKSKKKIKKNIGKTCQTYFYFIIKNNEIKQR